MTTHDDDDQPLGEVPAINLWTEGGGPPWARYHDHGAVDDCPADCPANAHGFTIEDPSAFVASVEVVAAQRKAAVRYLTVDPPVIGEDYEPRRVYTIADIEAMRTANMVQRLADYHRRTQPGYPHDHRADYVEMDGCRIPRPRPKVFERRLTGDQILMLLSLLAVGAIAAWIILAAGR